GVTFSCVSYTKTWPSALHGARPAATVCPASQGDRVLLERAADPLHRAGVNSKLFGNDADTGPPRRRQSLTDSFLECGGDWGTPKAFTLTPGPPEASTDSFLNHRPLQLGRHAHQPKHRLPGGGRGVEPIWRPRPSTLAAVNLAPAVRHGCPSARLARPLGSSTAARSSVRPNQGLKARPHARLCSDPRGCDG